MNLSAFPALALLFLVSAPGQSEEGALSRIGDVASNRSLLEDLSSGEHMFIDPTSAYVIVERKYASTSAAVRYRNGERTLWFSGNRTQFRILIQAGRTFTVVAKSGGHRCFERGFQISREGVWRLRLPC